MKYLGIDYGRKKIGLALSEGQIASPLKIVDISSLKDAVNKIKHVIEEEEIARVVIGVPEGETGKMVKMFCKELEKALNGERVEVIQTDETLSSQDARKVMIDMNLSMKERGREDAYSAMLILQRFLNNVG